MKRVLVLSVLLGLLVLPVFAEHVTIDMAGDMTVGVMGDFGDNESEVLDLTWDVIVGIDDYNSFTWSLKDIDAQGNIVLDKALVTTDIGMWAGLPVGVKAMWGYDDPDANEFAVTSGYENEQVYNFSPLEYWGLGFLLSYNMIEVEVAFNPTAATPDPEDLNTNGYLLAGVAVKEPIPGLNAEVYWFQGGAVAQYDEFDLGQIGFGASYMTEVAGIALDTGASFLYDMNDAAADAWKFGLGVKASMDMFDATVGVNGDETDALAGVTATVMLNPIDMASIYAGFELDLQDAASETFAGADLGVVGHVGIVEMYLGYLITTVGNGNWKAPDNPVLTDGGAYIKFDVDY